MMDALRKTFTPKYIVLLLVIWQFFSVLLMAIGYWPYEVVWLNAALGLLFVLFADTYHVLLLLIASIPFYVAMPNARFDALSVWRIWFVTAFLVWVFRNLREGSFRSSGGAGWWRGLLGRFGISRFMPWDRFLGYFFLLSLVVTLALARFKVQGLKQLVYFLNAYLLYVLVAHAVTRRTQVVEVVRTAALSLVLVIGLGYVQLASTFFTNLDTFWVYWASFVSRLYYGRFFSGVALYSNSWFSYTGGRELRMFSIMPDSQSFGYLCVFAIGFGTALTFAVSRRARYWLWSGIRFASLAVILSGTRAVWVGAAAPMAASAYLHFRRFGRLYTKKMLAVFSILVLLFAASPLINMGLRFLRVSQFEENFVERAQSIYDLQETSNAGRIRIWLDSLRFATVHPQGVGLDNFLVSLVPDVENYEQAAGQVNERYNLPQQYVSAHSLYLQVLVEAGVVGLIVFMLFWLSFFRVAWKFLREHREADSVLVFFVFQAGLTLLWLVASAVFDVTLLNDKVLMYFFLTLGLTGVIVSRYGDLKNEQ